MTCYITLSACMKCMLSTFSSTAAEPARPIKGPDERLSQRAQLSSPIQTLTYAAAVAALGCSCGEGQADGGWPGKVASTVTCVCLCVCVCL